MTAFLTLSHRRPGLAGPALSLGLALLALLLFGEPARAEEAATKGPLSFTVETVLIEDLVGTVIVEPGETDETRLVISGPQERVDEVTTKTRGDRLVIEGARSSGFWSDWSRWRGGRSTQSRLEDLAVVTLEVPKGSTLEFDSVVGAVRIGDLEGALRIESSSLDGTVGDLSKGDIGIAGRGDLALGTVEGPLSVAISGSGSLTAENVGGPVRAGIAGSGEVRLGSVDAGLSASVAGSGEVRSRSVDGPVDVDIAGSGDVIIDAGRANPMEVSISGSGDVRFGGTAVDPVIRISGSGDVQIGAIEGSMKKRGGGDVTILGEPNSQL